MKSFIKESKLPEIIENSSEDKLSSIINSLNYLLSVKNHPYTDDVDADSHKL